MEHGDRLFGRDEAEPTRGVTPPLPREQQQGHDPAEQRAEHGACEQHEQHDERPRGGEDAAHAFTLYRQVDGDATGTDAQPIRRVSGLERLEEALDQVQAVGAREQHRLTERADQQPFARQ